jgi:pimeloyl-ACP methyl ester carboxylesterase
MRRALPALAAAALLAVPAAASATADAPLGHSCHPQNGVRFCPGVNDAQRVPSFDGVPLDVDVTLPATGAGPFPTVAILHGFPGSKASFEASTPEGSPKNTQSYHYNNNFFAKQGYAVLTYTARGFGRSCGDRSSRTSPQCDRGWLHFADQRWEIRDVQYLLGRLVDEGVADPRRIGVTGTSYGGLQSMQLAFLKNRVRTKDGKLVPWRSPSGRRVRVAAAWPRWGSADFVYSVAPNGRFLDFRAPKRPVSRRPIGVAKQAVVDALYIGGTAVGYLAPQNVDPTADLKTWRDVFFAGEPYGVPARAIAKQFIDYKSAIAIRGRPAPLLIMDGFTDPIFPAESALQPYARVRKRYPKAAIAIQLGDLGHFRAGNALALYQRFNDEGAAFFARWLKGVPGGPKRGAADVLGQGCPKGTLGPGLFAVASWSKLARGDLRLRRKTAATLTADGGDPNTAKAINPVTNGDPCSLVDATVGGGTAVLTRVSPGFTLAGLTTLSARVKTSSAYGQIDVRIWDVVAGKQRLIDSGVYRLRPKQAGRIRFQTFGNVYAFAPGHTLKVELLGRNSPSFLPDKQFAVAVSRLTVHLPTRDRPSSAKGIAKPPKRR